MRICGNSVFYIVCHVSCQFILSGADFSQVSTDELEESCTGSECAKEATQVPSLLQKAKSQMASTVVPDDDDLADEMAADLVMQELSKIGEMHEQEVRKTLALNRQTLMLEQDEMEATRVVDKDADVVESNVNTMKVPFSTDGWAGSFGKSATRNSKTTQATVYYKIDSKFIYLGMASNNGFVGAGMNGRNPSMRNADIVVCRDWEGKGKITARDFHATGNKAPTPDGAEDWIVTGSGIDAGVTWCVMHRARVTCEIWEDYQAYNDDTTLFGLVAWSNFGVVNDELAYHGYHQRDVLSFNFMGPKALVPRTLPSDAKEMKVEAPAATVPTQAGSYVCSYHVLPVDKKHHIIQWNAIWDDHSQAKKERVQHHMDMNACQSDLPVGSGSLVDCGLGMSKCSEVLLTGVSQYSPDGDWMDDDAGISIGGDASKKMLFSIHFYNPSNKAGIADTGTRFMIRYTEKLRKNNFFMFVITTDQIEIPGKTPEHTVQDYCTFECTERLKGTTEIRFIGFHMHRAGKKTTLRVVRDGHEIEPIFTVDPWDDAMSAARIKRTVVPGDSLLGECIYKNPESRIIPYGPELENEMCVVTLSVVGPGSMKMCADLPMGQLNPPGPCKVIKNGKWNGQYRPWPVCRVGIPMTFCPDAANTAGQKGAKPMLDTAAGHSLKFVSWGNKKRRDCVGPSPSRELVPAQPGSCNHGATIRTGGVPGEPLPKKTVGDRADACGEDATTHAVTAPNVIVGEIDIRENQLKVSWQTNCDKQEIELIVEAKTPSEVGWLALGLIDGGDAANPLGKTPNSMLGTDIVMLSPSGSTKLKDAKGMGYVPPHAKSKSTATYIAGGYQCGYTWARFKRPFSAAAGEGHTLKADGFVYLVAAYNANSGAFSQKHDLAQAMTLKTSFFGGRGESYRRKASKVEPESEPEPESEAEKKVNKPIFTGKCSNPIPTMDKCWAWAGNAGVVFTESVQMHKGKRKVPTGCFFHPDKTILYLNTHKRGSVCGDKGFGCICQSVHPEPEPEPLPQPWEVKAGICTKVFTEGQCLAAAKKVFGGSPSSLTTVADLDLPKGCFVKSSGDVFYNTQSDSVTECHHTGVKACVCAVEVTVITKAPAPAPASSASGAPKEAYKDVTNHCVSSNVVNEDECKAKAEEYINKHNLGFKIKRFRTFSTAKWPTGCWILTAKKKVFFNSNSASTVKCGNGGSWCMCKATFVIAKKGEDCKQVITTPEECQDAAKSQGYDLPVTVRKKHKKLMAGCYLRKGKLFFATGSGGINVCGKRKTACICEA